MKPGEIIFNQNVNGEHIVIRYPTSDDVMITADYINSVSAEQTYLGRQGEQATYEEQEKHIARNLDFMEKNIAVILLLFRDGALHGIADVHGSLTGALKHTGTLGISLDASARGKGLGSLFMRILLEETGKHLHDLQIIKLDSFAENEAAQKLYKKFGFIEYGRLPGGLLRKGIPHDHVAMYKKV